MISSPVCVVRLPRGLARHGRVGDSPQVFQRLFIQLFFTVARNVLFHALEQSVHKGQNPRGKFPLQGSTTLCTVLRPFIVGPFRQLRIQPRFLAPLEPGGDLIKLPFRNTRLSPIPRPGVTERQILLDDFSSTAKQLGRKVFLFRHWDEWVRNQRKSWMHKKTCLLLKIRYEHAPEIRHLLSSWEPSIAFRAHVWMGRSWQKITVYATHK